MSLIESIILGVIEGITEFLPISSTGHLILASKILGIGSSDFLKSFEISIQAGAILAVLVLYWRKIILDPGLLKKVTVAFVPTGIIGFVLYKTIKSLFFDSTTIVLWAMLVGGILLVLFELYSRGKTYKTTELGAITPRQAFAIGIAQSVSVVPGVSRAAATIVGGMLAGIDRKTIVEFSFLLAIPTMLAATGYDLLKNYQLFSLADFGILAVGFAASFVFAMAAIKFLLRYVQNHDFIVFGVYRILVALAFWSLFLVNV